MKQFFIIYDGVQNSVFASQVLAPLIKQKKQITIISFESDPATAIRSLPPLPKQIAVKVLPKVRFFGTISLRYAAHELKKILEQHDRYTITTRGPLAGWIAQHALDSSKCEALMVQARGLVADEYRYTHKNKHLFVQLVHRLRAWQYQQIERSVFGHKPSNYRYQIEAVSEALKDHLVQAFNASAEIVTIAELDIPKTLSKRQRTIFRNAIRAELAVPADAHMYCYNGSAKAWQCPQQVVLFFAQQLKKKSDCYLLLLSQDRAVFADLCEQYHIPKKRYRIVTADHAQVMKYLAACDTGLLFREADIINWVSRPTKVLEYRAAHLDVKHNGTVAWLQ